MMLSGDGGGEGKKTRRRDPAVQRTRVLLVYPSTCTGALEGQRPAQFEFGSPSRTATC